MVAVVIFWAALLAIIFFLLSTFFKTLLSMLEGGIKAIAWTLALTLCGFGIVLLLCLIYGVATSIMAGIFWSAVGKIILGLVTLFVAIGIVGGFGATILELIAVIVDKVICIVAMILEGLSKLCDKGYIYFLDIIMKRLDKC